MKSFWLTYAFWFSATFMLAFANGDFIRAAGISFIISVAVYVFFEFWFFEAAEEEMAVKDDEEEYVTIFPFKKD